MGCHGSSESRPARPDKEIGQARVAIESRSRTISPQYAGGAAVRPTGRLSPGRRAAGPLQWQVGPRPGARLAPGPETGMLPVTAPGRRDSKLLVRKLGNDIRLGTAALLQMTRTGRQTRTGEMVREANFIVMLLSLWSGRAGW